MRVSLGWWLSIVANLTVLTSAVDAELSLRRSVASPSGVLGDQFGSQLVPVGDPPQVLVPAPGTAVVPPVVGSVWLLDPVTGDVWQSFIPTLPIGSEYGAGVAAVGGFYFEGPAQVAIGSPLYDSAGQSDAGRVAVYDVASEGLIYALEGADVGTRLGTALTSYVPWGYGGDPEFLISAPGDGNVYRVAAPTGTLLTTYEDPTGVPGFGSHVASVWESIFVSSPNDGSGAVHRYDGLSGALQGSYRNPTPAAADFGRAVAFDAFVYVGAPDAAGGGAVYVFDSGGTLSDTWPNPAPAASAGFGQSLAVLDGQIVIGAPRGGTESGRVYFVDPTSADVESTFENPTPEHLNFGASVLPMREGLAIGAAGSSSSTGAVHVYSPCGDGVVDPGEACDDSNSTTGDCCSPNCEWEATGSVCGSTSCTGPLTLTQVLKHPTPFVGDHFGSWPQDGGTGVLVTSLIPLTGSPGDGAAYIIDLTTGALSTTFANPVPGALDAMGYSTVAAGDRVLLGAPLDFASGQLPPGKVYVFDATTGSLLQTLTQPGTPEPVGFGAFVSVHGSVAAIATLAGNKVYLFDTATGTLTRVLENPGDADETFGIAVVIDGGEVFVGAPSDEYGKVFVFSATSGDLLRTIEPPEEGGFYGFGAALLVDGDQLIVGSPYGGPGRVQVLDRATGALQDTISNPTPCETMSFGAPFVRYGTYVVIGAGVDGAPNGVAGAAYVFDTTTWQLVQTLSGPSRGFGANLGKMDGSLLIGTVTGQNEEGAVYIYSACGDGVVDPGEACDDDNNVAGDGCSDVCHVEPTTTTTTTIATTTTTTTTTVPGSTTTTTTLPPDPASIAPALDPSGVTTAYDASRFLYTGADPIQRGVDPETIVPERAAVVRGEVRSRSDVALGGVEISIHGHPGLGTTLSRADGMFDLVVNGGGPLTLVYTKPGHLTVHRQVNVPWQQWVVAPTVEMLEPDVSRPVDLTSSDPFVVAQGIPITDGDGTRQATLLFPQGTTASMHFASPAPPVAISSFDLGITEYTVGDDGPQRMPASLPAASAYTYAVELGVAQAEAVGATSVHFSQPVRMYVKNFMDLPVGEAVPLGYYDRQRAGWVPAPDGRIIKIVAVVSGTASVDITGDGVADDTTALGITLAERQQLASLYDVDDELWRVTMTHFSAWDCNWGFGLPPDAVPPNQPPPRSSSQLPPEGGTCQLSGSIIACETQGLAETIPVAGTPYALRSDTDRTGREIKLTIPLTGPSIPEDLKFVEYEVFVAGRALHCDDAIGPCASAQLDAATNLSVVVPWDPSDVYGRRVQGTTEALVRVGYTYPGVTARSLGGQGFGSSGGGPISGSRSRREVTIWQEHVVPLYQWNAGGLGIGTWSISPQHFYDLNARLVLRGDGGMDGASDVSRSGSVVAGTGTAGFAGDSGQAIEARLNSPGDLAAAPDGGYYIADATNQRIRHVRRDGTIVTIASGLFGIGGIGVGPDGAIYATTRGSTNNYRVRRIGLDGSNTIVAGAGPQGDPRDPETLGDGGPAVSALLIGPQDVAVGADGSVYITESNSSGQYIRRVDPSGIISVFAGTERQPGTSGDGNLATLARLNSLRGIAVGPNGNIYIVAGDRIRRIDAGGIISRIAGGGSLTDDGVLATSAKLTTPFGITVASDGVVYFSDQNKHRVWSVGLDGILRGVAGTGIGGTTSSLLAPVAERALLKEPRGVALLPDASLVVAETGNHWIRRVGHSLPGFTGDSVAIASKDGDELYLFTGTGRHDRTLDAITGAVVHEFAYDANGRLTGITDQDGNTTAVVRVSATAMRLDAPGARKTFLSLDGSGRLDAAANEAGDTYHMTYSGTTTRLATFETPNGHEWTFDYDDVGNLEFDLDPAGGSKTLTRVLTPSGYTVDVESGEGRVRGYGYERFARRIERTFTDAANLDTVAIRSSDGTWTVDRPDESRTVDVPGPDPRFGLQSPTLESFTFRTADNLVMTASESRQAVLSTGDPFSFTTAKTTRTISGREFVEVYTPATKTLTETTPVGRVKTTVLDARGRLQSVQVPGRALITIGRDSTGLIETITEGTGGDARVTTLGYDARRRVETVTQAVTDVLEQTITLGYDTADRVATQTFGNGDVIGFGHDANGNMTRVTPPTALVPPPDHLFAFTEVDLEATYTPPTVPGGGQTTNVYNLDRQLDLVTTATPPERTIDPEYDEANGRLMSVTTDAGVSTYGYDSPTGLLTTITAVDGGTLTLGYDAPLLRSQTWGPDAPNRVKGTVSFTYDSRFLPKQITVNDDTVERHYDNDGLLTSVTDEHDGPLVFTRDAQTGLVEEVDLGVVHEDYAYNAFGELERHTVTSDGTVVYDVRYFDVADPTNTGRDKLGRITAKTEDVWNPTTSLLERSTTHYTYDPDRDWLTSVTVDGTTTTYTYDKNGNRLGRDVGGAPIEEVGDYDDQDRLETYDGTPYTYTADGTLAAKGTGLLTTAYDYDALGNLRGVSFPTPTDDVGYVIDGLNRRIGKTDEVGELVRGYLWEDDLRIAAELDHESAMLARFVYGTKRNVPEYMIRFDEPAPTTTRTYRIVTDHLGSPRLVINASDGSVAQRIDYDEFGRLTHSECPALSAGNCERLHPFGFAGGLFDRGTGLVRFGARDYDPGTGTWAAKDPIRFRGGSANLYAYAEGDPVNGVDPDGLRYVCPNGPAVDLDQNVGLARSLGDVPFWFYNQVRNRGPWDYKKYDPSRWQDFGNFHFGIVGRAAGYPEWALLRGAGYAQQQAGTSMEEWGKWWGASPFGDDPRDQGSIRDGIDYYDEVYGSR